MITSTVSINVIYQKNCLIEIYLTVYLESRNDRYHWIFWVFVTVFTKQREYTNYRVSTDI